MLTEEQIEKLQRKEAILARIIYYSPYRDNIRYYLYHCERAQEAKTYEEIRAELKSRIKFAEQYSGQNLAKRSTPEEESNGSLNLNQRDIKESRSKKSRLTP